MATESVVSPTPEGADRNYELRDSLDEGAGDITNGVTRGGLTRVFIRSTSNLAIGVNNFHNINYYNNAVARCMNGIGCQLALCPTFITDKTMTQGVETLGLYRFETMISWAALIAAGVDVGVGFNPGDGTTFPALFSGAGTQTGIFLNQNNGAPIIITRRDAVTSEVIPLAWPTPVDVTKWVAVRFDFRAASMFANASVSFYINNKLQFIRNWDAGHKLPVFDTLATGRIMTHFIARTGAAAPIYALGVMHSRQVLGV